MLFHPYHIVDKRPWPVLSSLSILFFLFNFILVFHFKTFEFLPSGLLILSFIAYQWWRDIIREATFQGYHTPVVYSNIKLGIILFIIREVFFFVSFFWSYFHNCLAPDIEIGQNWPPLNIDIFNPYHIPLLNTIILLRSGFSITWAHHCLINKKYILVLYSLIFTILLGIYFSILQFFEYVQAPFIINSRIFGSTFFLTTGFHGIHVIIGTLFLCVSLARLAFNHFNKSHFFNFEAAAWYWHFVDVIWIFVYTFVYWWIFYFISIILVHLISN